MNKIDKIVKEMIDHANKAGKVVDCGACKNNGCIVCEESNPLKKLPGFMGTERGG